MKKQAINNINTGPGTKQYFIVLGIILSLTYIAYLPSLKNEFTNWDDPNYVYKNPTIQYLNGENLEKILREPYMGNYHPITMLSLAMDFSIGNLQPKTYHTTNLIIHLANTGLVFYFVFLLFGKIEIASISSLLFGIHALHVESVAWISERKDVLYTLFFLSSLIFYIKYLKEDKMFFYLLSILLFVFSNLSKGMAVSLSLVVVLIDYLRGRNLLEKKVLLEKIPFFVLSIVFGIIAINSQRLGPDTEGIPDFNLFNRLIFACYGFLQYIMKLILPYNLSAFYPYPEKGSLPLIYLASPAFILAIAALFIYYAKKQREFIFCFLFFLFNIILVLQILPVGKAIMADRYAYIPSIGFFLFIGVVYDKLSSLDISYKKISALFLSLYALMILFFTYERCKVWHDSFTLWTDVIEKFNRVTIAYTNRGVAFADIQDYKNAIIDYDKSISLDLKDSKAYNNKGVALSNLRRFTEAKENYDKALEISPNYPEAYYNRANVFISLNDPQRAIKDYNKVIQLNPSHSGALNNRGLAKRIVKDFEGALKDFNTVIKFYPRNAEAYSNRSLTRFDMKDFKGAEEDNKIASVLNPLIKEVSLQNGNAKVLQNDFEGAIMEFTYVIDDNPTNAEAYLKRGICKINTRDLNGAISDFTYVIYLNPNYVEAYLQRGIAKNTMGNYSSSIEDYNKAIELKSDYPEAYCNRGISRYSLKDLKGSMKDYNKAIELNSKFVEAYSNRGLLKSNIKDLKGALEDYNKCIELNPSFALAFNNRGVLYFNMGNKKAACEDWKKGESLGDVNSRNFLGTYCK